jgi:hypothetical protein
MSAKKILHFCTTLAITSLILTGCKNELADKKNESSSGTSSMLSSEMRTNAGPKISIVSTSIAKKVLTAGDTQTATVTIKSSTNVTNLELDIRIYNSSNKLISKKTFSNVKFIAATPSNFSFDFVSDAKLPAGTYNVQIGVWNSSWLTYLYETKDYFSVVAPVVATPTPSPTPAPAPAPLPGVVKVSVVSSAISKTTLAAGETQSIVVKLSSATSLSNLIADIRIYDSKNVMVVRKGFDVSIAAGGTVTLSYDYQTLSSMPAGVYNVQVGVWSSTWLTYLYEMRDTFTVGAGTTTTPVTTAPVTITDPVTSTSPVTGTGTKIYLPSATVSKTTIAAGQVQTASVSVYSPTAQMLNVGIKFVDLNGKFLLETSMPTTFAAGQTKLFKVDFALSGDAPAGMYSLAVGVFNSDYSVTHVYESGLAKFQVTAITQPVVAATGPMPANNLSMISEVDAYLYGGPYFVQNNMWGIVGLPAGSYWEKSGIGPLTSNKSISARWQWQFPNGPNEVKGYPAIGFGKKPGAAATPGSNLPKLVDSVISSICTWDTQSVYTGKGQLTYDLWLVRDAQNYPNFPQTPITHEIMLTVDAFGGYGAMRNPAWYFSSTVIDGISYRVWKADNFGGGGQSWRFIVLQMVNPVHMTKGSIDFKHVFSYLKAAGLITGQEYLSSIEFGNEMEEGTGDVLVKDFKAEVL